MKLNKDGETSTKMWNSEIIRDRIIRQNQLNKFIRSSRSVVLFKKDVLKDFAKFAGKHMCQCCRAHWLVVLTKILDRYLAVILLPTVLPCLTVLPKPQNIYSTEIFLV